MQMLSVTTADPAGRQTRVLAAAPPKDAASSDQKAKSVAVTLLVGGVLIGGIVTEVVDPRPFTPAEGIGIFAVFYIAAQALERVFELIRMLFPAATAVSDVKKSDVRSKAKRDLAAATNALANGQDDVAAQKLQAAADGDAKEEKLEKNTSLVAWGLNSFFAAVLAGWLGLYLLAAVGVDDVNRWIDIAVTSLVIGGGTKPLHDLIKNLEKSKEGKDSE